MLHLTRAASFALAVGAIGVSSAVAQTSLADLMKQHGVVLDSRGTEGAFDDNARTGLAPGALALPLAILRSGSLRERTDAAYAFGIVAGNSTGFPPVAADREVAVGVSAMLELIASPDGRARVAAARVLGRVLHVHRDLKPGRYPDGVLAALFGLLNQDSEIEQLAAMDALGLMRVSSAVTSLTERYWYYRNAKKRALAGGALEALVRIGDPSTIAIVKQLVNDRWGEGKDATALVVAYARVRFLDDRAAGDVIGRAWDEQSRRHQAMRYSQELMRAVP
jgi:hypothetical protein